MKRYVISPIIGTGVGLNSYRAAVSDVSQTNSNSQIPTHTSGPDIGKPKYGFALSIVGTQNPSGVYAVSNSYVFPDYPLDGRMDGMESEVRTAMQQSVEAYNLDGNGYHFDASNTDSDSYRQLLQRLGQQIEPAFNIATFDITEPAE